MTFELDKGIILDQLAMNSVIEEGNSVVSDKSKRIHKSILTNTVN